MARFDPSKLPEMREWARALGDGMAAAEAPLLRLAVRMEQEGDDEDLLYALSQFLSHYARDGDVGQALEIAARMDPLSARNPEMGLWYDLHIANIFVHRLGEYERAAPFVARALSILEVEDDPAQRRDWEAWLRGIDLVIRVEQGASTEEGSRLLAEIEELLGGVGYPHLEILPTLARLIEAGCSPEPAAGILISMWMNLVYQWRFHAAGSRATLAEIERLLALVGYPVQREL